MYCVFVCEKKERKENKWRDRLRRSKIEGGEKKKQREGERREKEKKEKEKKKERRKENEKGKYKKLQSHA